MSEGLAVRSPRRVRAGPTSSGELLIDLASCAAVGSVLAELGLTSKQLPALRDAVRDESEPEPADWHLRLQQRGGRAGPDGELSQLLAIVRSADCHAYRMLQRAGADMGLLRKLLIERVRERGHERISQRPEPTTRPVVGPLRMSMGGAAPAPAASEPTPSARRSVPASSTRPLPASPSPRQSSQRGPVPRGEAAKRPAPAPEVDAQPQARRELQGERSLQPRGEPRARKEPKELRAIDPAALAPMIGRERELATLADALLRKSVRPPILVGEHGSGRSLLAVHVAKLLDRPLFRLEAPDYEDEDSLADDLELIAEAKGVVVFDDLDRVSSDTPPALLPALARASHQSFSKGFP
jgi:ATP-dependent Clp protease ATP-binding subunit ClpC